MSIVSSPLSFGDLMAASVYYEILGCDPGNLQPVCPEAQFETTGDGAIMAYYSFTANGSYVRAASNHGEFVKMTRADDGQEVFLHYSQVFCPTLAARRRMSTMAYVLGVAYQSTYRQMAMLNDLINEAAALNDAIRKLNNIFHSLATTAANYNSGLTNQILRIDPKLLQLYIDNGLQFPVNRICKGMLPQLYAVVRKHNAGEARTIYHNIDIFFIKNTPSGPEPFNLWEHTLYTAGNNPKPNPVHTLAECLAHSEIAFIIDTPEAMERYFATTGKVTLTSTSSNNGHFYAKCSFDSSDNMIYNNFFGAIPDSDGNIDITRAWEIETHYAQKEVDAAASCQSIPATQEEVLSGSVIGYFSQREANAFLDQARIAIDQRNNKLSGVSTMINTCNQELQQNYAVATATTEASSEVQQKTARNIR
jgi:hypothetical protein